MRTASQRRLGDYVYNPAPDGAGHGKHDHVVLETDAPARIVFNDHRRFGLMTLIPTEDLGAGQIIQGHRRRTAVRCVQRQISGGRAERAKERPIKSALLDQRVVAGLGNIYVCEALFHGATSRPSGLAGAVKKDQIAALVRAIKTVLKDAIAAGGSTLRDHAQATGDPGNFQHRFLVYGREAKPCRGTAPGDAGGPKKMCKGTVKRIVQAGRSTFYCPACQK